MSDPIDGQNQLGAGNMPTGADGSGQPGNDASAGGAAASGSEQIAKAAGGSGLAGPHGPDAGAGKDNAPGSLMTGQAPKEGDVPEAPDGYTFTFQPDTLVDEGLLTEFRTFAHKKGLTQGQAQELAQLYEYAGRRSVQQAEEALVQQEAAFRKQCQVDPEIGGSKFDENLTYATRAVEAFSTPGLMHVLHTTGFGSHPEVVRFFVRVGKSLGEKPMPKGAEAASESSLAELMFPSMVKK